MRSTDEKHSKRRLKYTTQPNLGKNTNTPTIELSLSISEVINFKMLKALKEF